MNPYVGLSLVDLNFIVLAAVGTGWVVGYVGHYAFVWFWAWCHLDDEIADGSTLGLNVVLVEAVGAQRNDFWDTEFLVFGYGGLVGNSLLAL